MESITLQDIVNDYKDMKFKNEEIKLENGGE